MAISTERATFSATGELVSVEHRLSLSRLDATANPWRSSHEESLP